MAEHQHLKHEDGNLTLLCEGCPGRFAGSLQLHMQSRQLSCRLAKDLLSANFHKQTASDDFMTHTSAERLGLADLSCTACAILLSATSAGASALTWLAFLQKHGNGSEITKLGKGLLKLRLSGSRSDLANRFSLRLSVRTSRKVLGACKAIAASIVCGLRRW